MATIPHLKYFSLREEERCGRRKGSVLLYKRKKRTADGKDERMSQRTYTPRRACPFLARSHNERCTASWLGKISRLRRRGEERNGKKTHSDGMDKGLDEGDGREEDVVVAEVLWVEGKKEKRSEYEERKR
jgi:hypothetical protein